MLFEDRVRADSFGEDAVLYDKARPSYPEAMIDALMATTPRSVLDVGCGTGIASRLLIARGCDVLGVEPDERMAELARHHGLLVERNTFEDWDASGRTFDLVTSAQAWHWVDPNIGREKAADILRPGGRIGIFSNQGRQDDDLRDALEAIYDRVAPGTEKYSILLRSFGLDRFEETARSLEVGGRFADVKLHSYPWTQSYSRDAWFDHLMTHNDHRNMDPALRAELLGALRRAIDGFGGMVTMHYDCLLVTALKSR
jgi:SAM-dependent methyltransferase